jgi:hypothetical protein
MGARWLAIAMAGCSFSPPNAKPTPDDAAIDTVGDAAGDVAVPDVPENQAIEFVQGRASLFDDARAVPLPFANTEAAGDLNLVIVSWANNATIAAVRDDQNTTYLPATSRLAVASTTKRVVLQVFYAANVPATKPTITVEFDSNAKAPEVRIAEYSGLAATTPIDIVHTAEGTGQDLDTGTLTTTHAHDLLVAAEVSTDVVNVTDASFTNRTQLAVSGDVVEDREVTATGDYHASAQLAQSSPWIMAMIAFIGASP